MYSDTEILLKFWNFQFYNLKRNKWDEKHVWDIRSTFTHKYIVKDI